MGLTTTAMNRAAESISQITDGVTVLGNVPYVLTVFVLQFG